MAATKPLKEITDSARAYKSMGSLATVRAMNTPNPQIEAAAKAMMAAGSLFHARGWVPATGGNFSVLLSPEQLLITASGNHKGELEEGHFLVADRSGQPLEAGRKASYETGLHTQLYRWADETGTAGLGSVLHTHSRANTVLSRRFERIALTGYELQKVLPGAPDPATEVVIPVFENDQDIARLAARVHAHMLQARNTPAYLIAGHGLYAWGRNVAEARYRVEAIEFMLDCHLTELLLK